MRARGFSEGHGAGGFKVQARQELTADLAWDLGVRLIASCPVTTSSQRQLSKNHGH